MAAHSLPVRDLLGFFGFLLGVGAAFWAHERLMRRGGHHRRGRLTAYLAAGLCYGVGLGLVSGLVNGGWGRGRFMRDPVYTPLSQSLIICPILGMLGGLMFFIQAERRRGTGTTGTR